MGGIARRWEGSDRKRPAPFLRNYAIWCQNAQQRSCQSYPWKTGSGGSEGWRGVEVDFATEGQRRAPAQILRDQLLLEGGTLLEPSTERMSMAGRKPAPVSSGRPCHVVHTDLEVARARVWMVSFGVPGPVIPARCAQCFRSRPRPRLQGSRLRQQVQHGGEAGV